MGFAVGFVVSSLDENPSRSIQVDSAMRGGGISAARARARFC